MSRRGLTLLLALNVMFFALGCYYFWVASLGFFKPSPTTASRVPAFSPADPRVRPQKREGTSKAPQVVYRTNQFHWSQVESSDYRTYIANLRAIGCPEPTIKDIIMTDVMKLFANRRGQFYNNGREFRFWETNEKRALNARQLEEKEKQLAQIDRELPSVLRELLGINYEREINRYFVDSQEDDRRLNYLSAEKRARLLELREEMEGLREKAFGEGAPVESLRAIDEKRRRELAAILTPAEMEEYELRTSPTADKLRGQLVGFDPSEEEFRTIYEIRKAIDEKYAYAMNGRGRAEDEAAAEELIKAKLGAARSEEYDRAKNQDFQNLVLFSRVHELPQSTATAILEIKQIAENETLNLFRDRTVSEQDRRDALRAIQQETERGVRDTLGDRLFQQYARTAGIWLQNLAAAGGTETARPQP